MALGVLNNLSAIYAENNLNNTNASLQTVLEQLSSGSKINSGADDAAGLSLVNGLEANQTALTQSKTNATEGVGLLQVADGALSQVTSLLDRAITLATEASNGTLNTTQESAANQEYQSILSEVNNIGQTTTYNQEQVFNGQEVAIYTGDSSMAGSSIDDLNIRTLSESSVGDSGGVMAYSDGANNVFINLSNTNAATGVTTNAQATDSLNAGGTTVIKVNYLVKGANGTESTATTSITVGTGSLNAATGSTYANTANGLIAAINASGLGLTATFATQTQAGVTGGGNQTGIEITGGLLSAGVNPSTSITSGVLNPNGIPATELLTQGQTVTIKAGSTIAASITVNSSYSTLTQLAKAITNGIGSGAGGAGLVTATVITNGDGTQSLSLADTGSNGGALTVTTGGVNYGANLLTNGTGSVDQTTLTFASSSPGASGSNATATLGISGTNSGSSPLSGSIVLSNNSVAGANPVTFVMASGNTGNGTIFVGSGTLQTLATSIQTNLGVSTTVGSSGITMTSNNPGTTIEQVGTSYLTATPALTQINNVPGAAATSGTNGSTTIAMNGGNGFVGADELTGTMVLTNGSTAAPATPVTFTMGSAANVSGPSYTTGGKTVNGLIAEINSSTAATHISATINNGQIVLTSTSVGTSIGMASSSLVQTADGVAGTVTASTPSVAAVSTGASLGIGVGGASAITTSVDGSTVDDTLSGSIVLSNGLGVNGPDQVTYTMGGGGATTGFGANSANVSVGGSTLSDLITAINDDQPYSGISATVNAAGTGMTLSTATVGTSINVTSSGLTNVSTLTSGVNGPQTTGSITLANGGVYPSSNATLTGTVIVTSGGNTDTFVMGSSGTAFATAGVTITTASDTLASLMSAINNEGGGSKLGTNSLGLTASTDPTTGGIDITGATGLAIDVTGLTNTFASIPAPGSNGAAGATNIPASVSYTAGSGTDPLTGSIVLQNSTGGGPITFVVGATGVAANTYYTGIANETLAGLQTAINTANTALTLNLSTNLTGGNLTITSTNNTSTLTQSANNLVDTAEAMTGTVNPSQPSSAVVSTGAQVETNVAEINGNTIVGVGDTLTGNIVLSNGLGNAPDDKVTFTMGGTGGPAGMGAGSSQVAVGGSGLTDLMAAVNADKANTHITAGMNSTGTGLTFTTGSIGTYIGVDSSSLSDLSTMSFTTPPNGSTDTSQNLAGVIALTDGGKLTGAGAVTGNVIVTDNGVTDTFVMNSSANNIYSSSGSTINITGTSLSSLVSAINAEGSDSSHNGYANLGLTASQDGATGGIYLESATPGKTGLTANTTGLTETLSETGTNGLNGTLGATNIAANVTFGNGGTNAYSDPIAGSFVLSNTASVSNGGTVYGGGPVTFIVGGDASLDSANKIYTGSTAADETMQGLANAITYANTTLGLDLSALPGSNGLVVTSTDNTSILTLTNSTLVDQFGAVQGTSQAGGAPTPATNAFATVGTGGVINPSDTITGSIVLTNSGGAGGTQTFTMGTGAGTVGTTMGQLASAISLSSLGLAASVNATTGALILQANSSDTTIVVGGTSNLKDTATEVALAGTPDPGAPASPSTTTMTLASGAISSGDTITGSITLSANGNTVNFNMGATAAQALTSTASNVYITGTTLYDLEQAIDGSTGSTGLNIGATQSGSSLVLKSNLDNSIAIGVVANSLNDDFNNLASQSSLGSFANPNDQVSGTITYTLGSGPTAMAESISIASGSTVSDMVAKINGPTNNHPYGVTATLTPTGNGTFERLTLTSDTFGTSGVIEDAGTSIVDSTNTAALSYKGANAYNTGLSSGTIASGTAIYDSSSGQSNTAAGVAQMVSDGSGLGGVATISYSDGAGESVSATDLLNQTDAETALNELNLAISDVAAQDGYIGAQINTLNSISQVMSTQQENVVSAQNAIQATDYASATSNMSKYEILSQTGIAALAQANSVEQEVTKLLQ
ncbi:MAG: flagellin [Terracidiphilus sp.]